MIFPSICLVTAFVMSTWFVDNLAVALYLWICGPPGSGKTTLLRLLHCLCRRARVDRGNYSVGGVLTAGIAAAHAAARRAAIQRHAAFLRT